MKYKCTKSISRAPDTYYLNILRIYFQHSAIRKVCSKLIIDQLSLRHDIKITLCLNKTGHLLHIQ